MNHQHKGNSKRNEYLDYNQMRASYVECMLSKSIKKNYTLSTFRPSNRRNFEDSGKALTASVLEFCQSVAVEPYHPMLIRWLPLLYVYYK